MATPFFRGQNFTDWLVALLLQTAADWGNERTVEQAAMIIGPSTVKRFLQATTVFPDVYTCVTDAYVFVISASTQGKVQWVGNVLGSSTVEFDGIDGEVSKYFGITAIFQYTSVAETVAANIPGRRLVLIGFSLGGATCTIMKELFAGQHIDPIAVFAFASPRPGTQDFVDRYPSANYQRIAVQDDPVPSVPPYRWSTRGIYTGFTWIPPTAQYGAPTPAWAFDRTNVLHEGQFDQNLPEVFGNLYTGDVYRTHAQPYYATAIRRHMPDFLPNGYDGFDRGETIDEVAQSVLQPSPVWPWPHYPPVIVNGGSSTMGSQIGVFMRDNARQKGYEEVYYSTTAASKALLDNVVNNLIPARKKMLARYTSPAAKNGMEIYAARVSNVGSPRVSFPYRPAAPILGTRPLHQGMANIEDCAVYQGYDATSQFKRQFHFRGVDSFDISDEQITEGGELDTLVNGASPNSLVNVLKSLGVAVHSTRLSPGTNFQVTGATQANQGDLITLAVVNPAGFVPGTLWDLRGCRQAPLLNGRWQAAGPTVANQIVLSGSWRYSVAPIISGTLYEVGPNYQNLDNMALLGGGTKKTGRPPFSPRGRKSAQLKHR